MIKGQRHTVICTCPRCKTETGDSKVTVVNHAEGIQIVVRDHQLFHVRTDHTHVHTVTLIFDPNDETDPLVSALLSWKLGDDTKPEQDS